MYITIGVIHILSTNINNTERKKNFVCVCSFLLLWLIMALRDETIGVDLLQGYIPMWDLFSGNLSDLFIFDNRGREIGWQLYYHIIKIIIGDNFNLFLAITAFLILLPVFVLIRKESSNPILSIIIYASFLLYHFSFSGLRQALAISVVICSYRFLKEKRIIPFVLCVVAASFLHKSAIVFLMVYPLSHIKIKNIVYVLLIVVWSLSLIFLRSILNELIPVIFENTNYSQYIIESGGSYMLMIFYLFIFLTTFFINGENVANWRMMFFLLLLSQSLGLVTYAATRIGYYFLPFFILILPEISNGFKGRKITNFLIVAFMVFFFFYNNAGGYLNVIPYKFFWQL